MGRRTLGAAAANVRRGGHEFRRGGPDCSGSVQTRSSCHRESPAGGRGPTRADGGLLRWSRLRAERKPSPDPGPAFPPYAERGGGLRQRGPEKLSKILLQPALSLLEQSLDLETKWGRPKLFKDNFDRAPRQLI